MNKNKQNLIYIIYGVDNSNYKYFDITQITNNNNILGIYTDYEKADLYAKSWHDYNYHKKDTISILQTYREGKINKDINIEPTIIYLKTVYYRITNKPVQIINTLEDLKYLNTYSKSCCSIS